MTVQRQSPLGVRPQPARVALQQLARDRQSESGTIVYWKLCDRLDHRRASTIGRKLIPVLGRVFRHFIWDGVQIVVNGEDVQGIDPLYLHRKSPLRGASLYERPLEYKVRSTVDGGAVGVVTVTFSELPIEKWHSLPNDEKRALGIANGAGVSVIRGGREIDYGWFFMGGKRRENYDDWWRCEVKFEPILDEAFGITHTKQQIRPREHLLEAISPELTEIAKALNSRVRQRHTSLKVSRQSGTMEQKMEEKEKVLPKLPNPMRGSSDKADIASLARVHRALSSNNAHGNSDSIEYRIVEDTIVDGSLFRTLRDKNRVVVVLNTQHAFYRKFYSTLHKVETVSATEVAAQFQAMFLSAARAEALITRRSSKEVIEEFREQWGKALSVLVND